MNTKKLLKILGFIIGPLIPLTIAMYFLFPYLNEEKYEEIAKTDDYADVIADDEMIDAIGADFETIKEQVVAFRKDNRNLQMTLDSLRMVNDSLKKALASTKSEMEKLSGTQGQNEDPETEAALAETTREEEEEEFKENIKSFLSLDDENLAPIINQLSDDQLVRLYKGGSSLHRKKLLRTLESKRAAQLMTEVM
ncbi:hypothetical protein SAMN05443144_12030 [Fodinibius roseus]|uniref:MgtE intracellular N domain-containing protein n=1 Tax=Fodinibius roseus TaxID=1194090 RepID=A0A1M5HG17_9BACT|nr:hypothetical protein [Fodinibius roseus]SHG14871.1 hypothetical protein SAMN05443144_12030 [Fodinibius roseus]